MQTEELGMELSTWFIAAAGAGLVGVVGFLMWYFGREAKNQPGDIIKENPNAHRDNILFGPKR